MSKKLFSAEELELEEMLNEDPQANFDIPLDEDGDIRLQTDPSYGEEKLYYDTHPDASGPEEELAKLMNSDNDSMEPDDLGCEDTGYPEDYSMPLSKIVQSTDI